MRSEVQIHVQSIPAGARHDNDPCQRGHQMTRCLGTIVLAVSLLAAACSDAVATSDAHEEGTNVTSSSEVEAGTTAKEAGTTQVEAPSTTAVGATSEPPDQTTIPSDTSTTASVEGGEIVVVSDLAYYESEGGGVMHLDVYHPASAADLPLVVLFHANPIFGGSKESMTTLATKVALRGAVVVVPSYGSRLFEPAEIVRWFREEGPCAVWTAVDLAPSFGANPRELVLFGETTGSFPASAATFSPPAEVSGCAVPATDVSIAKAIFFEMDWFFVPGLWDAVLADDPAYFKTIQPWDDLANPAPTSIHIAVGERTGAAVVRSMDGDSYEESAWVRLRDPGAEFSDAWASAGTLDDDEMSFTDVAQVLTNLLVAAGWNADLVTIPGVGHTLSTDASEEMVADLIFEEMPASAVVVLDGTGCSSTIPSHSGTGDLDIEIQNRTDGTMALVMGTYNDGFGHDDLVAYGRDISTRPDFIEALEIYEVWPQATRQVSFDHGPGRYFTTCLDTTTTMIVLDDLTIASE